MVTGDSVLPPAPVHVAGHWSGSDFNLRWLRRSRAGWRWIDGADAPLVEEVERYTVSFDDSSRGGESVTAQIVLPVPAGAMTLSVRQSGLHGLSRAARLPIPIS